MTAPTLADAAEWAGPLRLAAHHAPWTGDAAGLRRHWARVVTAASAEHVAIACCERGREAEAALHALRIEHDALTATHRRLVGAVQALTATPAYTAAQQTLDLGAAT